MNDTNRLTFVSDKTEIELNDLWRNCFSGQANDDFMHAHAPLPYRVPNQNAISQFLMRNRRTWLIKRMKENDIIGFTVNGDFIQGLPNNIGFNIGTNYIINGYARESLNQLI
jgi:RimJ/RimL family protein N-acetyltransferase